MTFYADLHVHCKYSRATSRDGDLEHMALWARKKGVAVLGTGDFTHPGWFDEIRQKLVAAEPGLYRLSPDPQRQVDDWLGGVGGEPVRFMLQVEKLKWSQAPGLGFTQANVNLQGRSVVDFEVSVPLNKIIGSDLR